MGQWGKPIERRPITEEGKNRPFNVPKLKDFALGKNGDKEGSKGPVNNVSEPKGESVKKYPVPIDPSLVKRELGIKIMPQRRV